MSNKLDIKSAEKIGKSPKEPNLFKEFLIEELITYRKKNKITQAKFAEEIGVAQQVISKFEKGEVEPRVGFITRVVNGMGKELIIK
ncbi:MAG: helix-turn-helix domain-containing protein [Fusobacteriaceae bacterium]